MTPYIILVAVVIVTAAIDCYLFILSRRLRKLTRQLQTATEGEPPEVKLILPRIDIDEHRRITGIYFPPFDIDGGGRVDLAVPIIKGLGQMVLTIDHSHGSQQWMLDFDTGEVSPFTDVPGPFRAAFE